MFTVTNVTRAPQIAHVTLWTDWAYPGTQIGPSANTNPSGFIPARP